MRTISRLALTALLLASIAVTTACKDKHGEGGGSSGKGATSKAPAGPLKMTAEEFFADFSKLDGMAALDRYRNGVVVSGTVMQAMDATEVGGAYNVWVAAGGAHRIDLGFADDGAAAKAKGFKAGDAITASCKVGGMSDNYIMNIECVLQ